MVPRVAEALAAPFARCLLPCPAGALSRPGSLVRDLVSPALSRRRSQPARIVGQGSEQLSDDRFAGATGLPVEPEDGACCEQPWAARTRPVPGRPRPPARSRPGWFSGGRGPL